jgi:Ca2+-binding RTX toxin-like protein
MIGAADRLDGGDGNDYMRGGLGSDVFVFHDGGGDDIIADFEATDNGSGGFVLNGAPGQDFTVGLDMIELVGFAGLNAGNVMDNVADDASGNAVFTSGADSLTLWDVSTADLTADSFVFVII